MPLSTRIIFNVAAMLSLSCLVSQAQTVDVTAQVTLIHQGKHTTQAGSSGVVLWLTPLQKSGTAAAPAPQQKYTLTQKDKMFSPHLLVVPTGSSVDFPNLDPFFHNVFSLFNGKRFDLGLYAGHTQRAVRFDREGVSYIFCNIHPDMAAVVVSLSTPYYGVSTANGQILLRNVPAGKYRLNIWAENVEIQSLNELGREVQIGPRSSQLGSFHLQVNAHASSPHKNKFGENYVPTPKQIY
jgi:plastocyanin